MLATAHDFDHQPPAARRLADFRPMPGSVEPLFRDWLAGHRETLFRWAMARCGDTPSRRDLAEVAVSIQRLRGPGEFITWLYAQALQSAAEQLAHGGLREPELAGLAPELRTALRLVSRGDLRQPEAMAMLAQRLGYVRGRLLQTRLKG